MSEPVRPPSSERARAERKLATILFADLVSSTEFGASQDPERTRAFLERFYDAMAEEISEAGGTVEKFAGDAVMAAFGVPAAQEDHVERALHAALAMQRRMQELFAGTLALRIGVNSGEVVVGAARESSSFVTGDVVNVAARLEQAAEAGVVLVGERAVSLVAGAFEFGPTMRVPAKGKPEGVECRRLVRALSLMRARGVPGLKRVFVGRERELRLVEEAYGRARSERTPQLVTIIGEPGLGKTRLVREVWEWLGLESPAALRRTGRCPPYGRARTYAPIGEILTEHFGILASDPPERVLAQLGERTILALALGLDVAGELHPIEARDRLHDAWIELVAGLSADRPLAMLVEDLHWAEEPLLNLLERTLLEVEAPVLLLATGRPEFLDRSPTWGRRGRVSSEWVWLEPLAPDEVDRWLAEVAEDPPPTVRAELARAEGNPLFLEEVLGTLIERGVLRDDGWNDAAPAAEANVPGTIQAVLQARIDLLPAPEKGALKAAAVIGRVFWASAVHELLEGGWPDFGLLEQRDFVRRRPGSSLEGEREFVFKHALTRDVGYASLTMRERAHMHAAFAAWLERRGGGRDEDAAVLAHHFAEAVRPEEVDLAWLDEPERLRDLRASAVRWLGRAAELAARRHESEDAVAMLDLALGLVDSESTRIEVLTTRAKICELHYDVEGFRASVEEALELGPEPATAAWIYARLASFTLARRYMWRHPPPLELGRQWLAKALDLAEPGSSARGYALVAQALSAPLGNEEAAAEANAIGEAIGDVALVVLSMQARTHAATNTGQFQEAGAWAERTLARKTLGDPTPGAQEFYAAFAYARAGWPAKARQLEELSSDTMASFSRHEAVHAVAMRAQIQAVYGEWRDLAALASRAEAVSAANDSHPCQFNWRNLLVVALGLAHVGDEREARRLEELGRSTAVVNGPPEREPALLRLALLRGDEDEMRRILEVLPATGDGWCVDNAPARLDALLAVGEWERVEDEAAPFLQEPSYIRPFALRALGVCRGDASLVREAEALFATMGLEWRAEETRSLLSGPRGAFRAVTNPSRRGDPPAR